MTLTVPAASAGATAVICVAEFTIKLVAGMPPKETALAPLKLLPVMVTEVPPAAGPRLVLSDVTTGGGAKV